MSVAQCLHVIPDAFINFFQNCPEVDKEAIGLLRGQRLFFFIHLSDNFLFKQSNCGEPFVNLRPREVYVQCQLSMSICLSSQTVVLHNE